MFDFQKAAVLIPCDVNYLPSSSSRKKMVLQYRAPRLTKKNSRHFLIQSGVQPRPEVTRSHAFSSALRQPRVYIGSLLGCPCVIGKSDYKFDAALYQKKSQHLSLI